MGFLKVDLPSFGAMYLLATFWAGPMSYRSVKRELMSSPVFSGGERCERVLTALRSANIRLKICEYVKPIAGELTGN
jgi:hypothetical protein